MKFFGCSATPSCSTPWRQSADPHPGLSRTALNLRTAKNSLTIPSRHWRRLISLSLVSISLGTVFPGCASQFTRKPIEQFASSLASQDLTQLKEHSSSKFERKALRLPESAKDLKILKLPTGKITVVSEERIDDSHKKVVVEIGEQSKGWRKKKNQPAPKQLTYILARDQKFGRWVVDDILVTQQDVEGEDVSRKVTEQMDLLLTCREFLGAWRDGSREHQLSFCSEELKKELEQLPEGWQQQLTQKIAGNGRERAFRPEALMNEDRAGMRLDHPDGTLICDFRQRPDGSWELNDAALEPSGKGNEESGIRSVTKLARTLNRSAQFLEAYAKNDDSLLEKTASKNFFERCLKEADLATIPVPVPELLAASYEVRQFKDRTEVLLDTQRSTWLVTLSAPLETNGTELTRGGEQHVQELTEFTTDKQVKPLSAMFLAHDIVNLYSQGLCTAPENRNLERLRHLASIDFKQRVWEHPAAPLLKLVPIPEIEEGQRKIISTRFRGDLTEVTVSQGKSLATYILVKNGNWLAVDDVMISSYARPASLKANLELMLPLYAFASAAHTNNLQALIDISSENLDQMVWRQVGTVPDLSKELASAIMYPIKAVQPGDPWSIVQTGDAASGSEIRLVRQGSRYVVDSMTLIKGPTPEQHVDVLKALRVEIASRTLGPRSSRRPGSIMQANHFEAASPERVTPAQYETTAPPQEW